MKKPNFFIIGAPKSGTTSLSEYLRTHPNIFISTPKEPQYFASDFSKRAVPRLDLYLSLFEGANSDLHKAVGEASVCYILSRVAVSEILKFNPNAKFIVMLRKPIELVQSLHSQMVFRGLENVTDFELAWRAGAERKEGKQIPRYCYESKWLMYSDWGMLGEQVERLFATTTRERVKIILFEDFIGDMSRTYEDVLKFLGVPSDGRKNFPKINANKRVKYKKAQRGLVFIENIWRSVKPRLGLSKGFGFHSRLSLFNSEQAERKQIPDELYNELRSLYYQDVVKLSKLIGRDLSHWLTDRKNLSLLQT